MSSAPRQASQQISGPAGDLELRIEAPSDAAARHVAVVCHPHPLHGGNMDNKVAHILARAFTELGATAVRFNFRGVGRSGGLHDGQQEVEDVGAVLRFGAERWPQAALWLAGFSFGAAMALQASLRWPVRGLVTVAPALRWLASLPQGPDCPWLVVQGDRDELVDAKAVQAWVSTLTQTKFPPELRLLPGAEHFFHGRLNDVRSAVQTWAGEWLAE